MNVCNLNNEVCLVGVVVVCTVEDLPHKDGKLLRPGVVWFNEVGLGAVVLQGSRTNLVPASNLIVW